MWLDIASRWLRDPAERHTVRTRDGVRLALYRYRARPHNPDLHPVLCIHGLGSNRNDLDFPSERMSLARYLNRHGYDVWVVELRGAGRSSKVGWIRLDWVFDDYIVHDIPRAIQHVLEVTGDHRLHWIGHSMGGMLAWPFLVSSDPHLIRSCTAIGAPSMALLGSEVGDRFAWALTKLLRFLPYFPYRDSVWLSLPVLKLFEEQVGRVFYNPDNMDPQVMYQLIATALENVPIDMMLQAVEWYRSKHFRSYYRTYSFRENLDRITSPLLMIAGSDDQLTPKEDLRFVFDRVSSTDKRFLIFGREMGCRTEYGHVDLVLGRNSPEEVFPAILDWLNQHGR